jgi:hypothetical protein
MLLATTVVGDENVVPNGECELSYQGNDPAKHFHTAKVNANSGEEEGGGGRSRR